MARNPQPGFLLSGKGGPQGVVSALFIPDATRCLQSEWDICYCEIGGQKGNTWRPTHTRKMNDTHRNP